MGDIVNLRTARKRAKRKKDGARADTNRVAHGRPKSERILNAAQSDKTRRDLDAHRLEPGDGQ